MSIENVDRAAARALLEWQIAMGADEAIGELPANRLAPPPIPAAIAELGPRVARPSPLPFPPPPPSDTSPASGEGQGGGKAGEGQRAGGPTIVAPPGMLTESLAEAAQSARALAADAASIEALGALVASFDGCTLKRTATTTVFIDGNPAAPVLIIGEAPGAEEDRMGR